MIDILMTLYSNGIGHQVDEAEFYDAASQMPPATEAAEPHEMNQEQVPLTDDHTDEMALPDESVKPVEVGAADDSAEPEQGTDQIQEEMTLEQERPVEPEEAEQEVEGKVKWFV